MISKKLIRLFLVLWLQMVSLSIFPFSWVSPFYAYFPYWSEELKSPVFPVPNNILFLNPAFYVGFQAGYADNEWDTMSPLIIPGVTIQSISKDTGFAYNFYLGYNYHYFSIEGGYIELPDTHYVSTQNGVESPAGLNRIDGYALDFLVKGAVPLGNVIAFYAKVGAGYVTSDVRGNFLNSNGQNPLSQSHIGPAFGLGFNVAITCNLIADLNWLHFAGQGQIFNGNFNYMPQTDVFLGGLVYKIPVDYY